MNKKHLDPVKLTQLYEEGMIDKKQYVLDVTSFVDKIAL